MSDEERGRRKLSVAREPLLLAKTVEGLRPGCRAKDRRLSAPRPPIRSLALVMLGGLHVLR